MLFIVLTFVSPPHNNTASIQTKVPPEWNSGEQTDEGVRRVLHSSITHRHRQRRNCIKTRGRRVSRRWYACRSRGVPEPEDRDPQTCFESFAGRPGAPPRDRSIFLRHRCVWCGCRGGKRCSCPRDYLTRCGGLIERSHTEIALFSKFSALPDVAEC